MLPKLLEDKVMNVGCYTPGKYISKRINSVKYIYSWKLTFHISEKLIKVLL